MSHRPANSTLFPAKLRQTKTEDLRGAKIMSWLMDCGFIEGDRFYREGEFTGTVQDGEGLTVGPRIDSMKSV